MASLSSFGPAGLVDAVWQCPDLFPLAVDVPSTACDGCCRQPLPRGDRRGIGNAVLCRRLRRCPVHPRRTTGASPDAHAADTRWLDYGRDCYAGVTFSGLPDEERTVIAWMGNWDYAALIDPAPSRGAMTVPRRLSLVSVGDDVALRQEPVLPPLDRVAGFSDVALTEAWQRPATLPPNAVIDLAVRLDRGRRNRSAPAPR